MPIFSSDRSAIEANARAPHASNTWPAICSSRAATLRLPARTAAAPHASGQDPTPVAWPALRPSPPPPRKNTSAAVPITAGRGKLTAHPRRRTLRRKPPCSAGHNLEIVKR